MTQRTNSVCVDDNGVRFEPWSDGYAVGFKCSHPDGRVEFVYLNPSSDDTDGVSNVFVYHGAEGDPASDTPYHFYPVLEAS